MADDRRWTKRKHGQTDGCNDWSVIKQPPDLELTPILTIRRTRRPCDPRDALSWVAQQEDGAESADYGRFSEHGVGSWKLKGRVSTDEGLRFL